MCNYSDFRSIVFSVFMVHLYEVQTAIYKYLKQKYFTDLL